MKIKYPLIAAVVCLFSFANLNAQEQLRKISFKNFSLGLNTTQSPSKIYKRQGSEILGYSPFAYNVITEKTGALTRREGFVTVSSAPIDKAWVYTKSTNEGFLMFLMGRSLYYASDVAASSTTYTLLVSDLQSDLKANGYGDASTLRYSSIIGIDSVDTSEAWSGSQQIFFGKNDGDYITGLFEDKGNLIVAKANSIWKLAGYSLSDWYRLKINNYYGLPFMDTIRPYKNIYLGVSNRKSVIAYDNGIISDVSMPIKNSLDVVDNFIGGINYLHLTNKGDYGNGTFYHSDADSGYLALTSGTTAWDTPALFNAGTYSRTQLNGTSISLATSSAQSVQQLPNTSLSVDIKMAETRRYWESPSWKNLYAEYPLIVANDDKIIDGDKNTFITLRNTDFGYESYFYHREKPSFQYDRQRFSFLIDIGLGDNYSSVVRVDVYGSYIDLDYKWFIYPPGGSRHSSESYADYRFQLDLNNLQTGNWDRYHTIKWAGELRWNRKTSVATEAFAWTDDVQVKVTPPLTNTVRLVIGCDSLVFIEDMPDESSKLTSSDIFRVNEVEVFYNANVPEYYSTGTYTSSVATFGDGTYDYYAGTFSATDSYNYTVYGTTIIYFTRTSTDNINWESWLETPNETHFSTKAFRYAQWKASMATTNTEYTPSIFKATMDVMVATGTWLDQKRRNVPIYQRVYFIADHELRTGTTVTYWISYTTSSTMTDTYTQYDPIADVSSIQSTRTYVRHRVELGTTDGRNSPIIRSLTQTWNPSAVYINPKAMSLEGTYRLAVTTYGTTNSLEYVFDNNSAWWQNIGLNIDGYFSWVFKNYFYNSNGIHELREDVYTDNGSVIECVWESPDVAMSAEGNMVELSHVNLHALQTGTTVVFEWKASEYTDTYSSRTVLLDGSGVTIKKIGIPVMKNGKVFRFRVRDSTTQRLEIYGMDIYYKEHEDEFIE